MTVLVYMRVAVHPIKAALWEQRAKIKPDMTLRAIGALVGIESPQQIKHHLEAMVKMGAIDYIGGQYVFPKRNGKQTSEELTPLLETVEGRKPGGRFHGGISPSTVLHQPQ